MTRQARMAGTALAVAGAALVAHSHVRQRENERRHDLARQLLSRTKGGPNRRHEIVPRKGLPSILETFARRNSGFDEADFDVVPAACRLFESGEMRMADGGRWFAFTARQLISLEEPAFVWKADVRYGPFLSGTITEALIDAEGESCARLFGSFPLAVRRGGSHTIAQAQRYIAELPWAPLALLVNHDLHFEQIADDRVRVSLPTDSLTARVEYVFRDGEVVEVFAPSRMVRPGIFAPWRGLFGEYGDIGDQRIPLHGEAQWYGNNDWNPVWRGDILFDGYVSAEPRSRPHN